MKKIFLLFIFLPVFSHAQKKGYFTAAFGKDFPKHYHVIGGHFTGNKSIAGNIFLGAGMSFLKFDNTENFYFPLYANLSFMQSETKNKVSPIVFVQPGYGFYKHEETDATTIGGFTFHTSAGIVYPFLFHKKVSPLSGTLTIHLGQTTWRVTGIAGEEELG